MDNNKQYYVTYKFYDARERRLAIFAIPGFEVVMHEEIPAGKILRLYIIPCSKKDTFAKFKAKEIFAEHIGLRASGFEGLKGVIEMQIPVENDKPKFTFIKWCEDNYYKYIPTVMAIEAPMLYKGDELLNGKFPRFDIVPIEDGDKISISSSIN